MKHLIAFILSLMLLVASVATGGVNRSNAVDKFSSGIAGRITDPNGAVVVGASIKIVARSTKVVVSRKSNDQGEYVVDLNPDVYDVEAEADGFKKATRKSIPVFGEGRSYVDFVLNPKEPFDSRHP